MSAVDRHAPDPLEDAAIELRREQWAAPVAQTETRRCTNCPSEFDVPAGSGWSKWFSLCPSCLADEL
jgi:hypothetical protein